MTCERKGRPGFVPDPDRGTAHLQPLEGPAIR